MSWHKETRKEELLRSYVEKDLTPEQATLFHRMCEDDPALGREARALEAQSMLLSRAAMADPPAGLAPAIMQAVRSAPRPSRLQAFLFRPRTLTYRLATGFSVAAGLGIAVFFVYWLGAHEARTDGVASSPEEASGALVERDEAGTSDRALVITLRPGPATHVRLVGDFNGWQEDGLALTDADGDGLWTVTLDVAPGRYSYRILVDGERWVSDPGADVQVDDGFGGIDSVRYVL